MGLFQIKSKNGSFSLTEDQLHAYEVTEIAVDRYHLVYKNLSLQAKVNLIDLVNGKVDLKINGIVHELTIEDELKLLIDSIGLRISQKKIDDILRAPMPGLVLNVLVVPQQEVKKGDSLVTLEAMKMENVLKAHHDGVIKSVSVLKGDKVEKGQILVAFEN